MDMGGVMDELFDLLREKAVESGEHGWTVKVYSDFFSLEAATKETADSPAGAWPLAETLLNEVTGLGYEMVHFCRVGTTGEYVSDDREAWRGLLDVRLKATK